MHVDSGINHDGACRFRKITNDKADVSHLSIIYITLHSVNIFSVNNNLSGIKVLLNCMTQFVFVYS